MLCTRRCGLLEIELPIISAPMGLISMAWISWRR